HVIVLHPQYKDSYFIKAKWSIAWHGEALRLLKEEWEDYKPSMVAETSNAKPTVTLFADVDNFNLDTNKDKLDQYLSTPPDTTCADPITYWNARLASGSQLARMGLDILSIPATSVDVERAFSCGRLMVSHLCHILNDTTTRNGTVLGSWAMMPGLIPEAELVKSLGSKAKRGQGSGEKEKGKEESLAPKV
ncbi:hypothetical protein M422DRAFT_181059, partial [Sphaerobolus stellatus SS14]